LLQVPGFNRRGKREIKGFIQSSKEIGETRESAGQACTEPYYV
jgi:hypothetical protein